MERQQLRRDGSDSVVRASDSPAKQQPMALIQTRALTPLRPPLVAITDGESPRHHPLRVVAHAVYKVPDERAYLLPPPLPTSCRSPTSSATSSPYQTDHRDRVYPWSYQSTSTSNTPVEAACPSDENKSSNANASGTGDSPAAKIIHAFVDRKQTHTFTRLIARAQSMTASATSASAFYVVNGSTAPAKDQRRRHSILRVSSNQALSDKPLRKSASVEFALHHEDLHKLSTEDRRLTASSETPRRLTFEEKEELYRVRPDLEIGPIPFYKEHLREMEQRNQRRMVFAVVGGMMCLMFLMVVYYVLSLA